MAAKKTDTPPEPKMITKTPSGIEIAYYDEPRRFYTVRQTWKESDSEPPVEVPSVTTILGCLDKPGLPWWGMGVGADGVLALWDKGIIARSDDGKLAIQAPDGSRWLYANQENILEQLTLQKLTVNHTLKKAGDRGQGAHDAFEAWAVTGEIPEPANYPEEEQPYLRGLRQFCLDMGDAWKTQGCEIAVGSIEHEFAGRYDLRGMVTKDVRLITQSLTKDGKGPLKKGLKYTTVPGGTKGLVDLKTSKRVYPNHLMQLEAYEGGGVECGYEPTDWRAVLHVTMFGTYEFKRARATYDDFLALRRLYTALEGVKAVL